MAKTQKIVKQPQPIVKNKKLALAAMILGYIALGLFILGGVLYFLCYKNVIKTEGGYYASVATIIISQVVAVGFAGVLLAKIKKHDSKGMKVADLVVGIVIIVAVALLALSLGIMKAVKGDASRALSSFAYCTLAFSEAGLITGCVFSTIDYVHTKRVLAK